MLREIREADLYANARRQEQRIREGIAAWKLPAVTQVRGMGLLLGVGLNPGRLEVAEGKTPAQEACGRLLEAGLLVPPAGAETIRLLPPLNVSDAEVDEALEILRATLAPW